jgi:hypothetical protein
MFEEFHVLIENQKSYVSILLYASNVVLYLEVLTRASSPYLAGLRLIPGALFPP